MKQLIKLVFTVVIALTSMQAISGKLIMIEDAFELEPSVYFLGKNLTGAIHGKVCETCPLVKLTITPQTRAYNGEKEVSLASKVGSTKKPRFTYYNIKSRKVTRLVWY